jgi:hypothetical protein
MTMNDLKFIDGYVLKDAFPSIRQPVTCSYEPQPDITVFELATLLPYMLGRPLYQEDWDKLGEATRHLKRL